MPTVLHVEDDPGMEFLFRRLFAKDGLAYHCVRSVEDAMSYIEQHAPFAEKRQFPQPDMIVTDLRLAGRGTAAELIRWLRQRPEHERTPIVVLTGGADRAAEEEVMQAGASAFIVKGSGIREMMEQLRSAMRVTGLK